MTRGTRCSGVPGCAWASTGLLRAPWPTGHCPALCPALPCLQVLTVSCHCTHCYATVSVSMFDGVAWLCVCSFLARWPVPVRCRPGKSAKSCSSILTCLCLCVMACWMKSTASGPVATAGVPHPIANSLFFLHVCLTGSPAPAMTQPPPPPPSLACPPTAFVVQL